MNYFDVSEFISRFYAHDLSVDFDDDGDLDFDDVVVFLELINK